MQAIVLFDGVMLEFIIYLNLEKAWVHLSKDSPDEPGLT